MVVSGLGHNRPNHIISELEAKGYEVEWYKYNEPLPHPDEIVLAVGHSAGGHAVQHAYGGTRVQVYSLNAPSRQEHDNVTHSNNLLDPVNIVANIRDFDPMRILHFDFMSTRGHDKNESFDRISGSIEDVNR